MKSRLLLLLLALLTVAACSQNAEPETVAPVADETAVRPQLIEFYADW